MAEALSYYNSISIYITSSIFCNIKQICSFSILDAFSKHYVKDLRATIITSKARQHNICHTHCYNNRVGDNQHGGILPSDRSKPPHSS